jgi:hypothetical protein
LDFAWRTRVEDLHRHIAKALILPNFASTEAVLKSADKRSKQSPQVFHFGTRVPIRYSPIASTFQNENWIAMEGFSTCDSFPYQRSAPWNRISLKHRT